MWFVWRCVFGSTTCDCYLNQIDHGSHTHQITSSILLEQEHQHTKILHNRTPPATFFFHTVVPDYDHYHAHKLEMYDSRTFLASLSSIGIPAKMANMIIGEGNESEITFCRLAIANGSSRSQKPLNDPSLLRYVWALKIVISSSSESVE